MTYFIVNLGCVKNQVDAEIMDGALRQAGWEPSPEPQKAQVILVNTCGFIREAQRESIQILQECLDVGPKVIGTGCLSQRWARSLMSALPNLAGCFGNRRPEAIVEFLTERLPRGERIWLPDAEGADLDRAYRERPLQGLPFIAYVKISEGCDHHCTYCAIPQIRGRQRDRPKDAILREVDSFLSKEVKEINLVAHDLASWGEGLVDLVRKLDAFPGEWWLRLLYIYPENFPEELIEVMAQSRHLVPYLDIPFQHGSPAVLRRMGRKTDPQQSLELIHRLRQQIPQLAVRTTFITGFRGETEEEFQELLAFHRQLAPEWAGIFAYSHEEGTSAWNNTKLGCLPPSKIVLQRKKRFEQQQQDLTLQALTQFINQETAVLVEEKMEGTRTVLGRTCFQAPDVDGLTLVRWEHQAPEPGQFIKVRITGVRGVDLTAVTL